MLTTDTITLLEIVQFLRRYHLNPVLPPALVQGLTFEYAQSRYPAVNIPYGPDEETVIGTARLTIDQFELTGSTKFAGGNIQPFTSYQHSSEYNNDASDYTIALSNPNLNSNPKNKSAIINMVSECSRSTFVLNAINTLLRSNDAMPIEAWGGLDYAFKHYKATCKHAGFTILAGDPNWRPLIYNDYENYVNSLGENTNKVVYLEQLRAVNTYVAGTQ